MKRLILFCGFIGLALGLNAQVVSNLGETWGGVNAEKLSTFVFANDTMTLVKTEGVIAFGFKANANNLGYVFVEGVKQTISGIESEQIPFDAGEVMNNGLLIAVTDSVTLFSTSAADTCIVTVIKK